jgi:hypothetical protein
MVCYYRCSLSRCYVFDDERFLESSKGSATMSIKDLALREEIGRFVAVERISSEDLKVSFEIVSSSDNQIFLLNHTLACFLHLGDRYVIQCRGAIIVGIRELNK